MPDAASSGLDSLLPSPLTSDVPAAAGASGTEGDRDYVWSRPTPGRQGVVRSLGGASP
jgi:hypothetical protein